MMPMSPAPGPAFAPDLSAAGAPFAGATPLARLPRLKRSGEPPVRTGLDLDHGRLQYGREVDVLVPAAAHALLRMKTAQGTKSMRDRCRR